MQVVDACECRSLVIASLFKRMAKADNNNTRAFSMPFLDCEEGIQKRMWLIGEIGTSMHGFQDYAASVLVKRVGLADKIMWATTICTAFDKWQATNTDCELTLDNWFGTLDKHAFGMLRQVFDEDSFGDFKMDFRRSLY